MAANPLRWFRVTAVTQALALILVMQAAPAGAVSDAERLEIYKQFRAQFDARQYAAARPLAEQLVKLTEEQYGPDELVLTNPLTNLATVNLKLGDYRAAIDGYQRTLRILQAKSTMADKQQIRPLHGLGVSFMGARDPESAVVALKRAADLSRNTDGLFNINQVEFIDALIQAYAATGRAAEAEKEALYALRIEEAAYGRNSVKLLDRLDKLARWYEAIRRYPYERNTYDRALGILDKNGTPNDLRRIVPLRGISRSFRLEAFTTEANEGSPSFVAGPTAAPLFTDGIQQRRGETVLNTALQIIDANAPADQQLRGEVLSDLGDWYLIANSNRRAYDTYAEAWKAFEQVGSTRYLSLPRLLYYRASISSIDRSALDPAEAVVKTVELHFPVDRDGRVGDVTSPTTDVPENIVRGSMLAVKRSRYAPRIENGVAVPTDNVVFFEQVLVRAPTQSSPDAAAPPSGTEAEKPAETPQAPAAEPTPVEEPAAKKEP